MALRDDVRDLFTFRDSPTRWPFALQSGFAMARPVAIFTVAGYPQLGLLASSGGFTALYLTDRSRRERARVLPLIAIGLIVCSVIGAATAASSAASLVALFAVTAVAAIVLLGFGAGPPGPLFFMLVTGLSSHVVAPASAGGAGGDAATVIIMIAAGCAIAYAVVLAPLLLPSLRGRDAEVRRSIEPLRFRFRFDEPTRAIVFRVILGSGIATALAAPLGVRRVYWVVLTLVAILQSGHRLRLTAIRGIHRVVGTLLGVGTFALVLLWNPRGLVLALLLGVLQFLIELVVIRNYGLALILIPPLALIIAAQASTIPPATLIAERVIDTVIGGAIAMTVLLVALAVRRYRAQPASGADWSHDEGA